MRGNNQRDALTADDIGRLERSTAWQQRPAMVEALCRLLYEFDPVNIWSGVNPHAMTEYLFEVEMLVDRLPKIRTESEFTSVLATIFDETYAGAPVRCSWADVATAAWPILFEEK
jgi:hypothetical protein